MCTKILVPVFLCLVSLHQSDGIQNPCDEEFPWDEARLPQTVFPIHYDLVVHPNLTDFTFRGSVNIVLNVTEATDLIVLNSADLVIDNVRLRSPNDEILSIAWRLCGAREQLAITVEDENDLGIRVMETYNLSMTFRGNLTDTLKGLYRSSYKSENGVRKYMAVTQFSPTDARRMFPCWDEPLFKATFRTSIIRDPSAVSLSNMPILNTVQQADNLQMDNFETTLKMSTYLIAVVVFDFPKMSKRTKTGVEVSLYSPQLQINQTAYALDVAVDALEFHEAFLKIPFPLNKLDIVAVGDFAFGAMENWGLMTFRDTIILHDPEKSATLEEDGLVEVVSHEIGHQWFGNLVTMKWWADLWMKEGFANFLQVYAASKIRPDWGLAELFGTDVISAGLKLDALKYTHPVYVPVEESSEIRGIFDAISYSKGASIIFMLLNIFGEENLAAGLNDYLTTYQYSNAEGSEFWEILAKHATSLDGLRLDEIADTWTLQPGHPYITVSANKTSLVVRQQRFYYSRETAKEDNSTHTWAIPFTFTTDNGESKLVWFNSTDFTIPLKRPIKRWFKANTNGTGFYRVLYKPRVWRALGRRLRQNSEAFSTMDRSNLIMDAFGFVHAGLLNVTVAFDLAKYLRFETEYGPWKAALEALDKIGYIHVGTPLYEPFRTYVRSLLEPVYRNASWNLPSKHKEKRFFAKILSSACQYDIADCKNQAVELFKAWLNDGAKISPDLLKIVMTEAIASHTDEYWDVIWNEYVKSNAPSEKTIFLSALCSTPVEEKILWLLNASLDSTIIRANLLADVARTVAQNPNNGTRLLWQFTKDNWAQIYKVAGGTAVLGNYLSAVLINVSEKSDLEEAQGFFSNRDVDGAKRSLDQTMENVQLNIQWREINDADLETYTGYFSRNTPTNSASSKEPSYE
jgi:aminopeptidase N